MIWTGQDDRKREKLRDRERKRLRLDPNVEVSEPIVWKKKKPKRWLDKNGNIRTRGEPKVITKSADTTRTKGSSHGD